MISKHLCGLLFVGAGLLQAETQKTALDGVYTAAQAARGQAAYDANCSGCHGPGLDGGGGAPALRTFTFLDAWREDFLSSLFLHIQTRMPPGSGVGTLAEKQYVDIVAYILATSKFPAGASDLTRAAMDTTLLTGPGGPSPLPASSTVRVVGCLAHASGAWTLTHSSSPSRVRNGSETDPAELERSAHVTPGTRTFQLLNLDDDHTEKELLAQIGRRVQVKGVLNGEGDAARVYALSFEALNLACDK